MKHDRFINRTIFVASLVLFPLLLPVVTSAEESKEGTRSLQERHIQQIAVESSQDTLKACLDRIPADATAGQAMLAKQNCQQVEVERTRQERVFSF